MMILPVGAGSIKEAARYGVVASHTLNSVLSKKGLNTTVGDAGGFAPDWMSNEQAVVVILQAIMDAGFKAGVEIFLALDVASSSLYSNGKYTLVSENKILSVAPSLDYPVSWYDKYPINILEDSMAEDDWQGWTLMTERPGNKVQMVEAARYPGRQAFHNLV